VSFFLKLVLITSKIISEKQIFVEEIVQKKVAALSPAVIGLGKIDHWYWTKYFIDIYRECPYLCSYCNTARNYREKGLRFSYELPERNQTIGLGLLSDIYHPDPSMNKNVTDILKVLYRGGYAVTIQTKSDALLQDIELLKKFALKDRARVTFTILTNDGLLSSRLEEGVSSPEKRLEAVKRLNEEGVPTGIAITPIIPLVNDSEKNLSMLVKSAKQNTAKWALFSGFTPTSTFLNNPEWKETARMHSDPKRLNNRYRRVKGLLIRLLVNEGIPMRMPRINRGPLDRKYSSDIVSEHLFNISYLYELLEENLQAARYRNAACEVNDLEQSLKSIVFKKNHGYIKWINPEIEGVIEEHLYNGSSSLYSEVYNRVLTECTNV